MEAFGQGTPLLVGAEHLLLLQPELPAHFPPSLCSPIPGTPGCDTLVPGTTPSFTFAYHSLPCSVFRDVLVLLLNARVEGSSCCLLFSAEKGEIQVLSYLSKQQSVF